MILTTVNLKGGLYRTTATLKRPGFSSDRF